MSYSVIRLELKMLLRLKEEVSFLQRYEFVSLCRCEHLACGIVCLKKLANTSEARNKVHCHCRGRALLFTALSSGECLIS